MSGAAEKSQLVTNAARSKGGRVIFRILGSPLPAATFRALVWLVAVLCLVSRPGWAQTAPVPRSLPFAQDFGGEPFSTATLPPGFAAWGGLSGAAITNAAAAATSAATADAAVSTATTTQSAGGCYGLATGGNGRFYIQTSGNTSNGANQLALAITTAGLTGITLDYTVESVVAMPRTVGVVCQYRVGAVGGWSTLEAESGQNPLSQAGGTAGVKTRVSIPLPTAAENQPAVQIRWAVWRGTEGGTSSGLAIDDVAVSAGGVVPDRYAATDGLFGVALLAALQPITAENHVPLAYDATLNPLRAIHADPHDADRVITVYSGTSLHRNAVFFPGGNVDPDQSWDREHVWPSSFGLDPGNVNPGGTGADAGPDYTDLFNLRPCVRSVNSARGNLYFDRSSGNVTIPHLAPQCSRDDDSWEPADSEKGDLARGIFYMAARYDGREPNTLNLSLGETPSGSTGRFARLSTLLQWHLLDPVDERELELHERTVHFQGNRNPFVDRPDFAARIWGVSGIPPVALPLAQGGPWSPLPAGFSGVGVGTYSSSLGDDTDPGSVRFDGAGQSLAISISAAPGPLNYRLRGNPTQPATTTEGTFVVRESADGFTFSTVRTIINKGSADEKISDTLAADTRLIVFEYETRIGGNIQLDQLAISPAVTVDDPWVSWLDFHELSGASADLLADPDGDGIVNGLEFVLGGNPKQGDSLVAPRLVERDGGLSFEFSRERASIGIATLAVRWSDDLVVWQEIPIDAVSSGPVTVTVTPGAPDGIRVEVPAGKRRFFRLVAAF